MEQILKSFQEQIAAASSERRALRIVGGASKDWYGNLPRGEVLDTRAYSGVVHYDPTELVITARCGTPLTEIEAALAEHNQMLAFEPPHFGATATVGGMVACGLSGPRRQAAGALRDYVLGAVLMDGKGEVLHFGGQVMKNVAGYDVSRLLAGSLGMLGLLLEASIKVLPRPVAERSVRIAVPQNEALSLVNHWGGQPLPISATAWHEDMLTVRLSGAGAAVDAATRKLGGETVADADAYWMALREQTLPYFAGAQALWRLSLLSTTPGLDLPGAQMIEWGGAQRWLRGDAAMAEIRVAAEKAGGHATLFRGGDKSKGVFHPLVPAVARVHGNLKAAFDPQGIFNPGRMIAEL
ncbi:MAG TPA: glycolate oxidase subunit GlcE [Burkholderiaceae bacterium]|jgi:glycolate oxidase FAD binding subunit